MPYLTKIDASRQIRQVSGTTFLLSGSTVIKETLEIQGNFSGSSKIFSGSTDLSNLFISRGNYRDIYFDAAAFSTLKSSGATSFTEEYTGTSLNTDNIVSDYYSFTGQTRDEGIQIRIRMPDEWDLSTIKSKIYWYPDKG